MSNSIETSITTFQYITGVIEHLELNNTALHINDNPERNIDMDYSDVFINKKDTDLCGQISLIISLSVQNQDKSGVSIKYKFKGVFLSKDTANEKEFEQLLKTNGLAVLYSMARSHIATFSSLSGLETINIPMINVYNFIESKESKKE